MLYLDVIVWPAFLVVGIMLFVIPAIIIIAVTILVIVIMARRRKRLEAENAPAAAAARAAWDAAYGPAQSAVPQQVVPAEASGQPAPQQTVYPPAPQQTAYSPAPDPSASPQTASQGKVPWDPER